MTPAASSTGPLMRASIFSTPPTCIHGARARNSPARRSSATVGGNRFFSAPKFMARWTMRTPTSRVTRGGTSLSSAKPACGVCKPTTSTSTRFIDLTLERPLMKPCAPWMTSYGLARCGYLGTSTYAAWQVVEALWASKELGLHRFVSEQPPYNLLDRRIERELIPAAQALRSWPHPVVPTRAAAC